RIAIFEEAAYRLAQGGGFPVFGSHALDAEENTGDFALTGIVLAAVDGTEHGFQALPLLGCYPPVGRHLVSKEMAQKPVESSHVIEALAADRDTCPASCRLAYARAPVSAADH